MRIAIVYNTQANTCFEWPSNYNGRKKIIEKAIKIYEYKAHNVYSKCVAKKYNKEWQRSRLYRYNIVISLLQSFLSVYKWAAIQNSVQQTALLSTSTTLKLLIN